MAPLNGIDISAHQPNIDLSQVPADFVIIKAAGSGGYVSPSCDKQFQQAKALGKLRGIYYFYEERYTAPGDAVQQADFFVDNTLGYYDGMTIPVLDWESANDNKSAVYDVEWARRWLDRVHSRTGIKPWIYMSSSVTNEVDWSPVVRGDYGLWVAGYVLGYQRIEGYNVPTGLRTPGGWGGCAAWQYTSSGRLAGYAGDLDLNVFYGDRDAWIRYATPTGSTRAPQPVPVEPPASQPEPGPVGTYTVQSGDTLSAIAAGYGTSVQALAAANGIANVNLIFAGQVLTIPSGGGSDARTYTVQEGDYLSGIAATFGTDWPTLARINGLADPDLIYPGQVLTLP